MAVAPALCGGDRRGGDRRASATASSRWRRGRRCRRRSSRSWMAVMMSVNESMFQLIPGLGILLGGAIAALAGPRVALGVAGLGSLVVMVAVWVALRPGVLRSELTGRIASAANSNGCVPAAHDARHGPQRNSQHPQLESRGAGRASAVESHAGSIAQRACIDIGSNTTRLLVADMRRRRRPAGGPPEKRSFTRIRRGVLEGGRISPEKIAEVVGGRRRTAAAGPRARRRPRSMAVATAAIRQAANGAELVAAIREACGLEVVVLSGRAGGPAGVRRRRRRRSGTCPTASSAWSTSAEARRSWSSAPLRTRSDGATSFAFGSGDLADRCLRSDPPSERGAARRPGRVHAALPALDVPHPAEAVAVGGSATSLRLPGRADARRRGVRAARWRCSATERRRSTWPRFALDVERVRLLPAGLLILQAASELLGASLQIGRGGLREGVLLEAARPSVGDDRNPARAADRRPARRSPTSACGRRRGATAGSSSCSTRSTPTSRSRPGGTCPRSTPRGGWACPTTPGSTSRSCSTSGCGWPGCCSGAASPRA